MSKPRIHMASDKPCVTLCGKLCLSPVMQLGDRLKDISCPACKTIIKEMADDAKAESGTEADAS